MSKTTDHNHTKEKLLHHAAEIFLKYGYAHTTIRMITQAAGVNAALINYHYGDKETLYLEVVRYWAKDAFRSFPFDVLNSTDVAPDEKIKTFIYHTLVCLFGPEGRGTGFGRLLVNEAAIAPSNVVQNIVSETLAQPTKALTAAIAELTKTEDTKKLQIYTACIVGQTVFFYLSRYLTAELFSIPNITSEEDMRELSNQLYAFSIAALKRLSNN